MENGKQNLGLSFLACLLFVFYSVGHEFAANPISGAINRFIAVEHTAYIAAVRICSIPGQCICDLRQFCFI
jgi:hypothetical protein